MSRKENFITWVIEDINTITAEVGSPRDVQLQEFAKHGFLKFAFMTHGTNTYEITGQYLRD